MTLPASLPARSRLHALTVQHPGKATPTTSPPIVISLTDSTGRLRARWSVSGGQSLAWTDLAGFLWDDTIAVGCTGPIADASGEIRWETEASGA